jgi:hypothetical protein
MRTANGLTIPAMLMLVVTNCSMNVDRNGSPGSRVPEKDAPAAHYEELLLYMPDRAAAGEQVQLSVEPLEVPSQASREELLSLLSKRIAQEYFTSYEGEAVPIILSIDSVKKVCIAEECLDVGVINIIDPHHLAPGSFFQGTTSSEYTYNVLTANFLQPQLESPLLDAVIFLYNGTMMRPLDHIDLSGMHSRRSVGAAAMRALWVYMRRTSV